ncbi:MAG: DNA recombination protein RmuC [Deltaproteobacteria bacterium]|nr:DNA recombination protein RmuC [Deltaproteobacteria bacterium]
MDGLMAAVFLFFGLIIGGLVVWLMTKARFSQAQAELSQARQDLEAKNDLVNRLQVDKSRLESDLEHKRQASQEKLALLEEAKERLADSFKALSAEALKSNNQAFLELARANLEKFQREAKGDLKLRQEAVDNLIKPIKTSLDQVTTQINDLEKARREAYGSLTEQVKSLAVSQEKLQSETSNLVSALRRPQVRGRWGEIQLRRVVELAGMMAHCDFVEQQSVSTEEGWLRPDLIVKLPGGKSVVVDAKAPLQAYLDAVEAQDEAERKKHHQRHTQQLKAHVTKLSSKRYWSQFETTPTFVVMFLPGENFYNAALEQEPVLIEEVVKQGVILATPPSLIALLKAVGYGWQQAQIAESAYKISQIGRELYDRLSTLTDHFSRLGRDLDRAVEAYNKAVGSLEARVLVSARRFLDLGIDSGQEIEQAPVIDRSARVIGAPELVNPLKDSENSSDKED